MNYFEPLRKIEKWTIKPNEITKELLDLKLGFKNLDSYPALFLVNSDYCASHDLKR